MTDGDEVQKKSKRGQEEVIKELETVAANARVKDWTVSQDDIHFCVNMLDKHEQVRDEQVPCPILIATLH